MLYTDYSSHSFRGIICVASPLLLDSNLAGLRSQLPSVAPRAFSGLRQGATVLLPWPFRLSSSTGLVDDAGWSCIVGGWIASTGNFFAESAVMICSCQPCSVVTQIGTFLRLVLNPLMSMVVIRK